ncbi:hypothetical protein IEQ34_015130 [Dendrobium chrysotoxum]|uniref:E3 ubiquitin-protein ligase RMA n=1 Tax=Dendrobium chrysotoxum TaxID=161865 RepID=A0AAV7GNI6_DENCH|nr:hypothetical protein IEQ34_015130 [Dendrobium chrysotoxum]
MNALHVYDLSLKFRLNPSCILRERDDYRFRVSDCMGIILWMSWTVDLAINGWDEALPRVRSTAGTVSRIESLSNSISAVDPLQCVIEWQGLAADSLRYRLPSAGRRCFVLSEVHRGGRGCRCSGTLTKEGFWGAKGMADEENERRPATMDLNLYLGLPRSPRPRSLELGSDLSLSSLPLPGFSYSSESRAPEATSVEMEASASHAPRSPSHAFIAEADVPSAGPWQPAVEDPIPPRCLGYEPYGPTCAQETEGPSILYSPSNAQVLQTDQVAVEPAERDGEYHASIDEILGLHFVDDNSAQGNASQTPYSPSYNPVSADSHDEENFDTFLSLLSQNRSELYSRADGSSSQQDLLQCPEFRIRRLVESNGWRQSSLGQSLSRRSERTDFARHSLPSPEQLMLEIMSSQQSLATTGKQKAPAEVVTSESSEKEAEEKNRCATNFDCNICFDIAKDPIVTSCGHLFCWPCLYQWLHVHSDHKECPVCKGEVSEANITPIYGRGCSRSDIENKDEENSASGLSIPPRPCGNRLESWRQHFYPISHRVGEGIAHSWRRFLNYQIPNRSRFSGHADAIMQELLSGSPPAILTTSMTRRVQRERGITEGGASTAERRFPSDVGSVLRDGDPGQFVSIPIAGARTAADQASVSSTVAVIRSEGSARDASAEPNSAGSSRPYRRIEGSISSGSSDDGGSLRACKRRRLH